MRLTVEHTCRCGRKVRLPLALEGEGRGVECPRCGWRLHASLMVYAEPPQRPAAEAVALTAYRARPLARAAEVIHE